MSNIQKQTKSTERIRNHGEVFTHQNEVKNMLDIVEAQALRNQSIEARYLEPACGEGAFLIEILRRKFNSFEISKLKNDRLQWEYSAIIAISSLYGVDILPDNTSLCRDNLFLEFSSIYKKIFKKKCTQKMFEIIKFILDKNIICGNALEYTTLDGNSIIFSEFHALGNYKISRKDYHFIGLIDQLPNQAILDNIYKPCHYLDISKEELLDGTK